MNTKAFEIELRGGEEGGITAYASTFDRIPDSYGDVVAKGAFAKSLAQWEESGKAIPLLYGHQMGDPTMIIGTVVKAEEDDRGLLVEAVFNMGTDQSRAAHQAVLNGTLSKLSFAFDVLDEAPVVLEDGTKANELRELALHEVSLVIVPANPRAVVIDAKDGETEAKSGRRNSAADEAALTEAVEHIEAAIEGIRDVLDVAADSEESEKTEEPEEAKDGETSEEPTEAKAEEEPELKENENASEKENQKMANTVSIEEIIGEPVEGKGAEVECKTLGEHVAKSVKNVVRGERFSVSATPFKAATDAHVIGTPGATQTFDRNVYGPRPLAAVADLFASETISGNALTYYVENAAEGDFAVVAEGGDKPQMHLPSEPKTVPLKKIAGFLKESDEIIADAPWMATAINNRGVYKLKVKESAQLVADLLATSGIGTATKGGAKLSIEDVKKAKTQVMQASGMAADAIIINPADYDEIVLGSMSANYTVDPWSGTEPRLWGMDVCQSSAIAAGTAVVGAFKMAGSVVRKGGVSVETTNSNEDDFENNLVTIRIEERMALAVRVPAGFVKIA